MKAYSASCLVCRFGVATALFDEERGTSQQESLFFLGPE